MSCVKRTTGIEMADSRVHTLSLGMKKQSSINPAKMFRSATKIPGKIWSSLGNPFGCHVEKWGSDVITPPGVNEYEMFLTEEQSNQFDKLWADQGPLIAEFKTANGFEIGVFDGKFTVFSNVGNRRTPLETKKQVLIDHLNKLNGLYKEIYKNNLYYFLYHNKNKIENLYVNTLKPYSTSKYTKVEAKNQVINLINRAKLGTSDNVEDIIGILVHDKIIDVSTGNVSSPDAKSAPVCKELENIYKAIKFLTPQDNRNHLDSTVANNLANRMKERRKVYVGKKIAGCRRRAILPWSYLGVVGKRITQIYRSLFSDRVKTRSAIRGDKVWYKLGHRDKKTSLLGKYQEAIAKCNTMTADRQAVIIKQVEDFRLGISKKRPDDITMSTYNNIRTKQALEEIKKIDPEFKLIGELFQCYYENLHVVRNEPEVFQDRLHKYFEDMLQLASKRSLQIHGPMKGQKAGDAFEVSPQDKQQLYHLLSYVLPTEIGSHRERAPKDEILQAYSAMAEGDPDLEGYVAEERDYDHIGHVQRLIFGELFAG